MSGLILCGQTRAEKPYFIKTLGKGIASLEELCFFLYHHTYLLDERMMEQEFINWLKTELSLPQLAEELLAAGQKGIEAFAVHILKSVQYRTQEEIAAYENELKSLKEASPLERAKKRADYLAVNRNYNKAIWEYRKILKQENNMDSLCRSNIFHNLGVAYGKMFDFSQSSECFLEAFCLSPNLESLKQYKLVIRLSENDLEEAEISKEFPLAETLNQQLEEEIKNTVEENRSGQKILDELNEMKEKNSLNEYYKQLEKILRGWQEDCRRYMNS